VSHNLSGKLCPKYPWPVNIQSRIGYARVSTDDQTLELLGHLAALLVDPHPAAALLHVKVFDAAGLYTAGWRRKSFSGC
jgi:hypothetical protein